MRRLKNGKKIVFYTLHKVKFTFNYSNYFAINNTRIKLIIDFRPVNH
jgi:hypothetical protein